MLNYSIEEHIVQNILVFLDRVPLEGREADKLVQAKIILQNPIPISTELEGQSTEKIK